ncbi:bifunctional RecB family nuclease/DEAD/DEAH box helicase [Nocardia inohanensis]|uniref:bifunctional RecB family nuclease/DEAD/DEAH box helicase n=1 Tax=Nocardia inohanensis TaxID=209246 RepID=UPI00247FCD32|nr:AAA domain-containing protein [Nocardia inohanensis]
MCSTGDLVSAARCEFALLRALDAELGLVPPVERGSSGAAAYPGPISDAVTLSPLSDPGAGMGLPAGGGAAPFETVAATRIGGGNATRDRAAGTEPSAAEQLLADLRDRHGAGVTRIRVRAAADPAKTLAALRDAHADTLAALGAGVQAAAGAVVLDGSFAAHSDFLLCDSAPEAYDYVAAGVTGRRNTIATLLAAAACVDALQRNGFRAASHARIWSDGAAAVHSLADIAVVYQARRQRLESIVDAKLGELLPVQWGDRRFLACGRCVACTAELEARRDLLLVAGMRPGTRAQLRDAGITTVERLAAADATGTGIPGPAFTPLRRQAELQIQRERTGHPAHTLIDAAALAALPRPTTGDLFISATAPDVITVLAVMDEYVPAPAPRPEGNHGVAPKPAAELGASPEPATPELGMSPEPAAPELGASPEPATPELDVSPESATPELGISPEPAAPELGASPKLAAPELGASPRPAAPELGEAAVGAAENRAAVIQSAPDNTDHESACTAADHTIESGRGGTGYDAELSAGATAGAGRGADEDAAHVVYTFAVSGVGREWTESGVGVEGSGSEGDGVELLEFLVAWQREFPNMRIHHYRGELRPLLRALGELVVDGEDTVAELLPALVDLYPIVRAALIVGERSYDLGQLPPNPGAAGHGAEAVVRLRDWLVELAAQQGVRPARRWVYDYAQTGPDELEAALREFADSARDRNTAQVAAAFTAAALGYHRRERQPLRWAHEDRLDHPIEEWADTPGVLVADWGTVDTKWHTTGTRLMRRYLTLTGRLGTGNAPPPGTPVLTLYDRPAPGMTVEPGQRATAYATVLGCSLDTNFEDVVRVVELLPDGCEPYDELPTAIAPCPPGRDEHLEAALEDTAHQLLVALPEVPETAVFDLLCRRPPRLRTGGALPEVFGDHAAAVTAAVLDLANSYVAVQGPPGTGKTDTTARVVERLVTRYKWRVGVVARSHQVVEHVLDAVVQVGVLPELVAKAEAQAVAPEWLPIEPNRYERFLDNAVNGCVVGGLPRDFTDASHIPRDNLDLLVIADAGKFPLADAIAVGISARNLLLVGDPAPAAGRGAHSEPIAESVLGRVVGAHRTLPAAYGYFLDRTWRMHPRMSGPVSRLRYDNRLRSNETVTLARELEGITPGVRTVPVEHHGNSTESAEEAREIVRQVRTLLGLSWHTGAVTRRLHPHDILVVAPYHAQVARIRTLLSRARIEDVLVGTADHFQGREAAVVLVSMTTSAPKDAPHGIGRLLSRHWLTSAISRAMWAAIIVRSPLLTEYLPADAIELSDLAAVLQLDRV